MTPQNNDANKPQARRNGSRERWGALPTILGAAAVIIIVGAWFYNARDDAHPVTGHDAPASTQTPGK